MSPCFIQPQIEDSYYIRMGHNISDLPWEKLVTIVSWWFTYSDTKHFHQYNINFLANIDDQSNNMRWLSIVFANKLL